MTEIADRTVVELVGSVDGSTAAAVHAELVQAVARGRSVVIDLSGVDYISSAGLRILLVVHREAHRTGTRIALTGLPPEIRRLMSITGFLSLYTVVEEAADGGPGDHR
ncbi:MAG TPA: STAS domain-containing protein [Jatrophihabitans sp.]|nr:STAS domain-containing protein [Jatrophihabitans sp.]